MQDLTQFEFYVALTYCKNASKELKFGNAAPLEIRKAVRWIEIDHSYPFRFQDIWKL